MNRFTTLAARSAAVIVAALLLARMAGFERPAQTPASQYRAQCEAGQTMFAGLEQPCK